MASISAKIRSGAMAYLKRQYKTVGIFFAVMVVLLAILAVLGFLSPFVPVAFLTGGFFSGLSGFVGMKIATYANSRTANGARDGLTKKAVDKSALKSAKKIQDKEERRLAVKKAKDEIREIRKYNEFVEGLPIVKEELEKFNSERYKAKLVSAKQTLSLGEIHLYDDWKAEMQAAKHLPNSTKEEKGIRSDALSLAREKKRSAKLLTKHGKDNLIIPDDRIPEEIKNREYNSDKERRQAKAELKAYTKGVSVYRRITKPYNDARNLIIQAENYTHLAEIETLYENVKLKV
jgi:hypothetical protein